MNWLNFHHILYFKVIAQEGGISKASKKLLVGQPALSAQLKQLEESLGVQLFERRNRKLILTEEGKLAYQYASQIFDLGADLQKTIKDRTYTQRPFLKIGALDSVPKSIITNLVEYTKTLGFSKVRLIEGKISDLLRDMQMKSLDLILSNYPLVTSDIKVYSRSIGKSPVSIYANQKFAKLQEGFPQSLNNQPIVLPTSQSKLRHDVDHYFSTKGIHPEIVAETQDTTVQKYLGIDGFGVIPLPDHTVSPLVGQKRFIRLGPLEEVYEEYWLITNQRKSENHLLEKLLQTFKTSKSSTRR